MALQCGCEPCRRLREALLAWCVGPGQGERGFWVGLRRVLEFTKQGNREKGVLDGSVGKGSAGAGLGQGTA